MEIALSYIQQIGQHFVILGNKINKITLNYKASLGR